MTSDTSPTGLKNIDDIHQFEALFNFATIGIVVTDKGGRIINFNRYAETQFGYTKDEVLGELVDMLLPESAHHRHVGYRQQYSHRPEPRIMGHGRDLFARSRDGRTFPVEVSLSHYKMHGEPFVIAFVVDITVRKAHEAQARNQTTELERITGEIRSMNAELEQKVEDRTKMLREALAELERSKDELNVAFEKEKDLNELKSRFVTVASHEFRTPLSTILSSAYLMGRYTEGVSDPRMEKHIHRIKGAVEGMKIILEDFLSLGKMEEGLVRSAMEHASAEDLDSILRDLIEELDGLMQPGQIIQLENTVEGQTLIDRTLLKNILINLVSNAIKFSEADSVIRVRAWHDGPDFRISVADSGIGISAEDRQHLFGRFFRAANAGTIPGTGLGLHIVSRYLELMNGRISVESRLDEGTTVTITIPQL